MAFTFFGIIVATSSERSDNVLMNHERIHLPQWKDLFYIGFLFMYFGYSIGLLFKYFDLKKAYLGNILESEAFANEKDMVYVSNRKKFAWKTDLKTKNYQTKILSQKSNPSDRFGAAMVILALIIAVSFVILIILAKLGILK